MIFRMILQDAYQKMCYTSRLLINKFNALGTSQFTKFGEITQSKGHYAVHGHSRSLILVPIERSF